MAQTELLKDIVDQQILVQIEERISFSVKYILFVLPLEYVHSSVT